MWCLHEEEFHRYLTFSLCHTKPRKPPHQTAKTFQSKLYESRLLRFGTTFTDYADQLNKALTVHIALGIDTANKKLDDQLTKLQSIDEKVDILTEVFKNLHTPREKEVLDYIESNGGPKAIVENNELVQGLVRRSGQTMANIAGKNHMGKSDIDAVKEKLVKELSEDLDVVLERNFAHFSQKLKLQDQNMANNLEKSFASLLSAGTHDKIKDPVSPTKEEQELVLTESDRTCKICGE